MQQQETKAMITTLQNFEDFEGVLNPEHRLPDQVQAHDPFEAGVKVINALADDMSLDILTLDLDGLN